ncbi:hypothetical protein GQ457_01G055730 [Hibiscus cannabinus]
MEPESYIRVCVAACHVCNASSSESASKSKRRRFEYTESFDVPAKEGLWMEMHRVIGHKGGFLMDQDMVYGAGEYFDSEGFGLARKEGGDFWVAVLQQVQELRAEIGLLEGRIGNIPRQLLGLVSGELFDILSKHTGVITTMNGYAELIEDDEESFGRTLGDVVPWDQIRAADCRSGKDLINDPCKTDKWLQCSDFDEKNILGCEDTKLTKPMRHDDGIVTDVGLVGIQVDSFYHENPKWYDSPCGLDSSTDCGDGGFQHGEIV